MSLGRVFELFGLQRFISKSTFLSISTLMGGTVVSAVIPVIASPFLTRIFRPADFGVMGLYAAISLIIGVFAYSHYSNAVMLAKTDEEAAQTVWFTVFLAFLVSILVFLGCLGLYFTTSVITTSEIGRWYFLLPLSVLINGVLNTLLVWGNRHQEYKTLSKSKIAQAVTTVVIQICVGLVIRGEMGLMLGLLVGQIVGVMILIYRFFFNSNRSIGMPGTGNFRRLAIKYKYLFIFSTPSELINGFINQAPIFLLQTFSGIGAVGNFAMTQRLLGLPQLFLSATITDVFKQKASKAYHDTGNCRKIFSKTLKTLGAIGFLPFALLIIFAPDVIVFVFGPQWRLAGVFAQCLGVMYYLRFIVAPLSYVYFISGHLREDFFLHLVFLVSVFASFYIAHFFSNEPTILILAYSLTYSLVYAVYLLRSYKFSRS